MYPIAAIIIITADFIIDSNIEIPETTYNTPRHSEKIIRIINKYEDEFPNINFIYNKESFNHSMEKIGIYNLSFFDVRGHFAEHNIRNMLTSKDPNLFAFTYAGENCFITLNPEKLGSFGDEKEDGMFNINFILLHEIGHCKMNLTASDLFLNTNLKEAELWADIYAIKEIKKRKLNVSIKKIISDRGFSDMPNDEHLNGEELSKIDFSIF